MKIDELKLRAFEADKARMAIEREQSDYVLERKQAMEMAISQESEAKFGERVRAARKAAYEANEAMTLEVERAALAGDGLKHPIGTVMVRWERPRSYGREQKPLEQTKDRGVIEVITAESQHPGNLSEYSRANRGSWVIRLRRKDGSTGSKYVTRNWELTERWFPEGVNPNALKEIA